MGTQVNRVQKAAVEYGRVAARAELARMAEAADRYNELVKGVKQ